MTGADLCGHDETRRRRVDGDVTGHETNVLELFEQFPVLLVTQGLDGGRVDHPLFISQRHRNCIPGSYSQIDIS